jgi:hypothetical protein
MGSVSRISLAAAAALFAAGAGHPTLTISRTTPTLAVRGSHFRPAEKVRVTLTRDATRSTRVVRTTAGGTLAASFGPLAGFDPCTSSFVVRAVGASGDRASVKFVPRECPPSP